MSWENLLLPLCEQQRRRSACASMQSDQCLCCSLLRQYNTYTCYIQSFKTLASFCRWAGRFEAYLVVNPKHRFSHDKAHINNVLGTAIRQTWHGARGGLRSFIVALPEDRYIVFLEYYTFFLSFLDFGKLWTRGTFRHQAHDSGGVWK